MENRTDFVQIHQEAASLVVQAFRVDTTNELHTSSQFSWYYYNGVGFWSGKNLVVIIGPTSDSTNSSSPPTKQCCKPCINHNRKACSGRIQVTLLLLVGLTWGTVTAVRVTGVVAIVLLGALGLKERVPTT